MTASAADLDDYAAEMLRVSCRVVDAYRTEDPQIVARVMDEVLHVPAPPGAPNPLWALVGALAVQVDPDVPWRQRFAWTHDIARCGRTDPRAGAVVGQLSRHLRRSRRIRMGRPAHLSHHPSEDRMTIPSADHFAPSVVDPLCSQGHVVTEHMDRRLLWNLELNLRGSGSERLRDKGLALYRYLCATCEHHWHEWPSDEHIPAHKQCIWCNDVEWTDTDPTRRTA